MNRGGVSRQLHDLVVSFYRAPPTAHCSRRDLVISQERVPGDDGLASGNLITAICFWVGRCAALWSGKQLGLSTWICRQQERR